MMVIDSNALLWWLEEDPSLSETARSVLDDDGLKPGSLVISEVTFWELRYKECRGQLSPKVPVNQWPELLRGLPHLRTVGVGLEHWMTIAEMTWENRDPADRIIAATALQLGVPVLTVDRKFHRKDSPVEAVW